MVLWNINLSRSVEGRATRGVRAMATLHLVPVIDEGLGNSTYMLEAGR